MIDSMCCDPTMCEINESDDFVFEVVIIGRKQLILDVSQNYLREWLELPNKSLMLLWEQ